MDVILKAISTVDSKLASLEQKDGQLIFCKDTRKILLDLNGIRTVYEQITTINTDSQRTEILAPVDGFYFVLDTHILWRYSAEWIQITSQPADVVKINQGSSNSGKFLGIGPDGNVVPVDAPEDSVKIDTTLTKTGEAADAKIVGDELDKKINKSGWSSNKFLGTNESGNIIEKDAPEGESIPNGGTTGQVLTKKSNSDKDVSWADPTAIINKASESNLGGVKVKNATGEQTVFVGIDSDGFLKVNESGTPSDYNTVKNNSEKIALDKTDTYSIANNRDEIFNSIETSKSEHITITDGSEYWDADSIAKYPNKLKMKDIRTCRFYANMWLPNGLDMDQSYRYAVDKNGQIRLYDINSQKSDFASFLPWGMCLKGEGKNFPSDTINFVISKIKVLGLNNKTKCWEVALDTIPNGSLYIVQQTNLETEIVYDTVRSDLGNGLYQFTIYPNQWHYSNQDSEYDGYDMCFHFFGTEGILPDQMKQYDKLIVCFRMAIHEEVYSDVFTVSAGADAWGTVEMITEAFFSRFNPVKHHMTEYMANNCLEGEYDLIIDNMPYIDELLTDDGSGGSSSGGDGYTLPIMTETRIGGGKAIAKTTETIPVAVDSDGKLWVPKQSEGSVAAESPYDGKTVVMFGDSIVAGWGWEDGKGITEPLKEKYPLATWVNKAISGANMAEKSGASHPSIWSTVNEYMGEADYILLEGGTNDVNNSIPMGSPVANYDDSYDENSFCGALESALQIINDRYPLARKLFLVPHSFAKDNSYVDGIHDKAIEVCGKWNMPVLDMRQMSQIALTNANKAKYTRNPDTNQGDGVHPTETWYRAFYSPIVDQFMRSLGSYDGDVEPPENTPVTGVTLNQSSITLTSVGQTQQLQATVQPSNATNRLVTWESSHPEYATVTQGGLVQAVANGTAVIMVKTVDGNKTATCTVNVNIGIQPEEHTELPKITIDKNCYFDTAVIPSANSKLEIKVKVNYPEIDGTWVFGVRDLENKYTLSITDNWYCTRGAITSAAGTHDYWAGSEKAWVISQEGNVFDFDGDKVTLDDVSALDFGTSAYIGNANNNGSPYTGAGFNGDFYYCYMYLGDSMNAEIVPVKKKDGTLCLYDKIKHAYLYNLGTGKIAE